MKNMISKFENEKYGLQCCKRYFDAWHKKTHIPPPTPTEIPDYKNFTPHDLSEKTSMPKNMEEKNKKAAQNTKKLTHTDIFLVEFF